MKLTDLSDMNILVVEDEMMVLMGIEGMLDDLGCTSISCAATVADAITLISERTFDAAILDVNLTSEISLLVADKLVACGIPFLFSSGYGSPVKGYSQSVLRKPYNTEQLSAAFDVLLTA